MTVKPLPVHGVDISHHQAGALDLVGAKRRGLRWLYHKATEGTSLKDANYGRRRAEAARAGLPFGAYHFARADRGDAVAEARFFLDYADPKPGDLRPALDLETMEGLTLTQIREWARQFIAEVRRVTGHSPIVYTPYDLGSADDGCLLWRPRYNNTNTPPVLPWDIWQFSNGVYGVPHEVAGIGRVDLNVMKDGLTVDRMLLPKASEPKPKPETVNLRFQHASLQFSDTPAQQKSDAEKVFGSGFQILTGTEAGRDNPNYKITAEAAARHGYRHFNRHSNWISIDRDIIRRGSWEQGEIWVADNDETVGKGHDVTIPWVAFDHVNDRIGRLAVAVVHYPTKGRTKRDPNFDINERAARALGKWGREHGGGRGLAFAAGDFNMPFNRGPDPLFGEPFTSSWNELDRFEGTGHGNIDAILSYDPDARVSAKRVVALDDREWPLFTDHFVVRSIFTIRLLKA